MRKQNWLVEDNIVALYVALHKYKDLNYDLSAIKMLIPHKGFPMRIQNYIAIDTNGKAGLRAGLESPLFKAIHSIFKSFDQNRFAHLVNLILEVKLKVK